MSKIIKRDGKYSAACTFLGAKKQVQASCSWLNRCFKDLKEGESVKIEIFVKNEGDYYTYSDFWETEKIENAVLNALEQWEREHENE